MSFFRHCLFCKTTPSNVMGRECMPRGIKWFVTCANCGASGPHVWQKDKDVDGGEFDKAIALWNGEVEPCI